MRQHIPILGWCFIAYHAIVAIFVTGAVGFAIAAFLIVISLPGIIAGIGLLKYRPWARILAIILGALHLLSFPFGTALGVYTLVVLLNAETPAIFGQQPSPAM